MPFIFNILHWFSGLVLICLSLYCLRKAGNKTGILFCSFLFLLAGWAIFAALIFNYPDFATKIALNRIKLIFCALIPVNLFLLIRSFKSTSKFSKPALALLFLIPSVSIALLLSPFHEYFIGSYQIEKILGYDVLIFKDGPWFIVHVLQTRVFVLWALYLLGKSVLSNQFANKKNEWIILLGVFFPFSIDVLAVSFFPFLRYIQLVPVAMCLSVVCFYFVIFKGNVLEIVPIARNLIIDSIDDIYLVLDQSKYLVDFNIYAKKNLGLSDSAYGKKLEEIDFGNNRVASNLIKAFKTGTFEQDFIIATDVTVEYYSVNFESIVNTHNTIGTIIIVKNMTAQKKYEKQLTQVVEIRTKFIGIIAHDLIGNISSHSLLLETLSEHPKVQADEDLKSSIDLLFQSSQNINKFIAGLSSWSKENLENLHLKKRNSDLHLLINESLVFLQPIAVQKNIKFELKVSVSIFANIDFDMIQTAIRNILANAVRLSPPDGTITIKSDVDDKFVDISISDEGPGLNEAEMNQFLNRLDLSSYKGGLGLTLARDFIHLNNGVVSVKNNSPKGAIFSIKLPLLS